MKASVNLWDIVEGVLTPTLKDQVHTSQHHRIWRAMVMAQIEEICDSVTEPVTQYILEKMPGNSERS